MVQGFYNMQRKAHQAAIDLSFELGDAVQREKELRDALDEVLEA